MTLSTLIDGWRNRPAHERWLIGAPVVALVVAVAYLGIIEPLSRAHSRLERSLPALEMREMRIRSQAADVRAHPVSGSSAVARSGNAQAVIGVAQGAIERHRLRSASPTVERADDTRVRIAFARVPFHAVWPFFEELQSRFGVRVIALRIDRIDASLARVEATVVSGESR